MSKTEPIRILNIVPNMRAAGIETFIMNIYRNIDRNKVQFDFLVHNEKKEFYDEEIEKLGGKIYRLSFKDDKNIFKYIKDLNRFFKEHKEYTIVHGHMQSMMPLYLAIAKKNKVKTRIAHSHNNSYEKTIKGFALHLFSRFSKLFSTNNFACSDVAGKYLFGSKKYKVINNGINVERFSYDSKIREQYRKELNLTDKFVIGHIGRFEKQKNHKFLLYIFEKIESKNKDSVLLLIGEGKEKNKIMKLAHRMNLSDKIYFLGIRDDVSKIMQAMDAFVLPSLYEGLGIVLIEAQSAGLKCFTTKKRVALETNVSNNIEYIDLKNNPIEWANNILKKDYKNRCVDNYNIKKEFDICNISKNMQEIYLSF